MLKATQVGDVTEIKMGRSLDGETVLYWVAAYLIDGILIDTGCDYEKRTRRIPRRQASLEADQHSLP
jgi:hypothetical protein